MRIPLSGMDITQREIEMVNKVLNSDVYSIGPMLEEFEKKIREYVGVKHAIGVNSGTSALHLLVRALGIGEGDEVITTPFSFVASTNCFLFERAKPVYVDIDPLTYNIDVDKIEEKITEKTKAILPVDVFGQPVNMKKVMELAKKYNLKVIEDSAEALGSEYDGIPAGTLADGGVYAFYPNKQITTAEGGMIVTNDDEVAELCRSMRSQGRGNTGFWLHHERLGYNYRLSELHAALGAAQMERLDEIIEKRNKVAQMYNERLSQIEGIHIPYIDKNVTKMSWFVYVIRLEDGMDRNRFMKRLLEHGIACRPYFTPIHLQPYMVEMFGFKRGDFPVTDRISAHSLAIPFYTNLSEKEIDYVCDTIRKII